MAHTLLLNEGTGHKVQKHAQNSVPNSSYNFFHICVCFYYIVHSFFCINHFFTYFTTTLESYDIIKTNKNKYETIKKKERKYTIPYAELFIIHI